jgi:hypothetical protein
MGDHELVLKYLRYKYLKNQLDILKNERYKLEDESKNNFYGAFKKENIKKIQELEELENANKTKNSTTIVVKKRNFCTIQ